MAVITFERRVESAESFPGNKLKPLGTSAQINITVFDTEGINIFRVAEVMGVEPEAVYALNPVDPTHPTHEALSQLAADSMRPEFPRRTNQGERKLIEYPGGNILFTLRDRYVEKGVLFARGPMDSNNLPLALQENLFRRGVLLAPFQSPSLRA